MPDDHAPFVWSEIDDYGLTPEEFRLLHRISRRGDCRESIMSMARGIKMSESTVHRTVAVLLSAGLISKEDRTGDTSIIRVQPISDWASPETLESLRPKKKGRVRTIPSHGDTPPTETPVSPRPDPLSLRHPTPVTETTPLVTETPKGSTIGSTLKEVPKERGKRAARSTPQMTDDEWLLSLGENPLYEGIDIPRLYEKMKVWCGVNRQKPTRRRLVNWLNREEKPMVVQNNGNGINGNGTDKSKSQLNSERNAANFWGSLDYYEQRIQEDNRRSNPDAPSVKRITAAGAADTGTGNGERSVYAGGIVALDYPEGEDPPERIS